MRQRLPLAGLPGTPAFIRAYIADFTRVEGWFDYDPHSPAEMARRLAELDARAWPDLTPTAELAAGQQQRWGGDEQSIANAQALGAPQTYMVVTGQQAGLFGGPLYSQLKALTAVLLARRLAAQFPERRFVPVFWIASADSDFDEVSATTVWSESDSLLTRGLPVDRSLDGQILARRSVGAEQLERLIGDFADDHIHGLHREEVLDALTASYCATGQEDAGRLVTGFARWMSWLFRGTGLVVLEPEELLAQRPDIGALYAAQLRRADEAAAVLEAREAGLRAAGFAPQVELVARDTQVFHIDEQGRRDKLFSEPGDGFSGKRSGQHWSADEAAVLAESLPGNFTGSVLLRPVVEDALFPAAAWIGGGAELAYRAQSTALFALHGRRHAPAFLRHHATFITPGFARCFDNAGFELPDIPRRADELRYLLAQRQLDAPVLELLAEYEAAVRAGDALVERLPQLMPELERSMRTMRGKLEWHRRRVERKVRSAVLRRQETLSAALSAAHELVYPHAAPQERVLNLLSILPRAGFGLVQRLLEELDAPSWDHSLIMFA